MSIRYDEVFDVVVIGSGFAGLAAAIEARTAGASTIVLEKLKGRGGNSIISEGFIAAANTEFQRNLGIEDSAERMAEDMIEAGLGLNHPDLVQTVTRLSSDAINWTIENIGVTYLEQIDHLGGHSVPRAHIVKSRASIHFGVELVRKMLKKADEMGIEVRTRARVQTLVRQDKGPVTGVILRDGSSVNNKKSTTAIKHIGARKGVILAGGGFASDVSFRSILNPRLDETVETTNRREATADLLREAIRIGAMAVHLSAIQLGPWASPDERGSNVGANFASIAIFPNGIVVDPREAKRLLNERGDRRIRADALLATGQTCIGFVDARGARYGRRFLGKCLSRGVVKRFDTLGELASHYQMDAGKLSTTLENFNESVRKGEEMKFGRPVRATDLPVEEPPFYAIRLWPKVHYTSGGVQIDTKARVVGLDQQPIKGLFGAGEITGGVHGACRLGSCAITDCLVFGRIAGQQAAS